MCIRDRNNNVNYKEVRTNYNTTTLCRTCVNHHSIALGKSLNTTELASRLQWLYIRSARVLECFHPYLIVDANAYFMCSLEEPGEYLYAPLTETTHVPAFQRGWIRFSLQYIYYLTGCAIYLNFNAKKMYGVN